MAKEVDERDEVMLSHHGWYYRLTSGSGDGRGEILSGKISVLNGMPTCQDTEIKATGGQYESRIYRYY